MTRAFFAGVTALSIIYLSLLPLTGPNLLAGVSVVAGLLGVFVLSSKEGVKRFAAFFSSILGRAHPAKPGAPKSGTPPGSPDLPTSRAPLRSGAGSGAATRQAEVRGMRFPGEPGPLGAAGVGGREPGPPPGPEVK